MQTLLRQRRTLLPRCSRAALALLLVAAQLLALAGAPALAQRGPPPEAESGLTPKPLARARTHMVSSANPHATEAGLEILRAGGSAVDAAIAVQLVLGLVEPQSSGIGGGAFLMHWDQRLKRLRSYDGRETAPAAVTPDLFMAPNGQPRRFGEALVGGHSVGVPGVIRMLARAHARHGKLPWVRLFGPAIKLAEDGFIVSPRLAHLIAWRRAERFGPAARTYLFDAQGNPRRAGELLRNPEYAVTLRAVAERGPDAFYSGPIAEAIVRAVRESPVNPGALSAQDVAGYQAKDRPPVCVSYRRHRVCSMGPPSSGGLVTAMTLKLVEAFDLGRAPMNAAAVHVIAEAEKLAYADRDHWIADPDVVAVPYGLTDPRYLAERRKSISPERAHPSFRHGTPPGAPAQRNGQDATQETAGTSHASVVDRWGNAVALTTSIEAGFGSGLMAGGFLLNNQLTDFSFRPRDETGAPVANAVGPGKRPRSSMAPTVIFDPSGRLLAVLGAPGGSQIPLFVIKSVIGLIDWQLDAQSALDLPNFGSRNGPLEIEKDAAGALLTLQLKARGHEIDVHAMTSGLHAIVRRRNGILEGGADPRREGLAKGD